MERKFRQNSVFSTLGKTKQFKRTLENESIELRRMTRNTNEESTVRRAKMWRLCHLEKEESRSRKTKEN